MQRHATSSGAGAAGLATALVLRKDGWTVELRDRVRDSGVDCHGAAVLHPDGSVID